MAADRFLDTDGLRHLWEKIKSFFVSKTDFEVAEHEMEGKILLPNFDNLTPINTIEYDVSATSYYQLFSRDNTDLSTLMTEVDDIVMFRMTITGTNIYTVYDCYIQFRAGLIYPLVVINTDTYSVSAGTSGLYIMRTPYPKALNSGYDWLCDFRTYNATARHIKVEVFATTDNVHWFETLTATTYNSTYQTEGAITLYDRRGLTINGSVYTNALSASTAGYITSIHPKYVNSNIVKAGEALVSNYIIYVSNDYAFRISNKNNPIDVDFGVCYCGTSYSANNSYIGYSQLRVQGPVTFTTDANLTYDPIAIGDKVYLRCRLIGDKIYSDGHLSTKMTAGYTWYMLGGAYNTTQVSLNTLGSFFITLDENGMISHINGKPTQAALMNGNYERRFCGEIESDVSASSRIRLIEGRSLVFNQLVNNGDFSNGTTGWGVAGTATLSVENGVLSAYSSTGSGAFGGVTTGTNGKVYKGHKYFYSIYAKASASGNAYIPYLDGTYATRTQGLPYPSTLTTEWQRYVGLCDGIKDGQSLFSVRNYTSRGSALTIYTKNAMMIDLTKMFGAGNEPQDTELLKQMFPLDYYDYNLDGTLLGGTQTGFKSEDGQGTTLTNLSIPITTLTGKPTGSSTSEVVFPNGLLGIGDVRDEIDFENGTAIKRIGVVDLGSLSWTYYYNNSRSTFYTTELLGIMKMPNAQTEYPKILCANYNTTKYTASWVNKDIAVGMVSGTGSYTSYGNLNIIDNDYTSSNDFTTAKSGSYLHYVLETPIEYTIDTVPTVEYETERSGSEQWLPVNTSTPTVAPICCISRYGQQIDVPEYTIEKLAQAETSYSASYVLKKDNVQVGDTINIPKDYRLKSGTVEVVTTADTPYTGAVVGDKYLDLVVNTSDNSGTAAHVYVPLVGVGVQSDWEQQNQNLPDYIKNKPLGEYVIINGTSDGIQPFSLCAFALSNGGTTMNMTSFTTSGGTGAKAPIEGKVFPIGCKIYYTDSSTAFQSNKSFISRRFYTSYKKVDARYSAITGTEVSLSTSINSTVYLHVMLDHEYWCPYYKDGSTVELVVTSEQLVSGNFYIYLGKTTGSEVYEFQLEDNNPLYYYDGEKLIDWATKQGQAGVLILENYLKAGEEIGHISVNNFNPVNDTVHVTPQVLGASQKAQARENIDAQETLISGVNIKTINKESLLGDSDIVLPTVDQCYTKDIVTTMPNDGFHPDVVYDIGGVSGIVNFSLANAVQGKINHYFWIFRTGGTLPTSLEWPVGIQWVNFDEPTIETWKYYEISVLNGVAVYTKVGIRPT